MSIQIIRGTDISDNNGNVNISALPAEIAFVSMKGSQGVTEHDPDFQSWYHEMKNLHPEKVRIQYHYFDWEADGEMQAKNALSRDVDFTEAGNGPLMLDLEADSGSSVEKYIIANRALCIQRVNAFIACVRANSKRQDIIIYSFDDFIKNTICHTWPDTILWIASYQPTPPPFIPGWHYKFWQYSEFGLLDGTVTDFTTKKGSYDLDRFMGTQVELNTLANIK